MNTRLRRLAIVLGQLVIVALLPLGTACVSEGIVCGPYWGTFELTTEHSEAPGWRLAHVNADGSVVLIGDTVQRTLPPPGGPRRDGQFVVLASDATAQSATISIPPQRTGRFLWWEWASDDEDSDREMAEIGSCTRRTTGET